jgi:transposase
MRGVKQPIVLRVDERVALERLVRGHNTAQHPVRRASIVLGAGDGEWRRHRARRLHVEARVVTTWVKRWVATAGQELSVAERLAEGERSGAPDTFPPEQVCQILALACEPPERYGRPITHWTPRELAAEAVTQGIVASISARHVGRLLDQGDIRPHMWPSGENGTPDPQKDEKTQGICTVSREAPAREQAGELSLCVDETPGIQALERQSPTKAMRPESDEKIECNDHRHGTQAWLAGFNVATGQGGGRVVTRGRNRISWSIFSIWSPPIRIARNIGVWWTI